MSRVVCVITLKRIRNAVSVFENNVRLHTFPVGFKMLSLHYFSKDLSHFILLYYHICSLILPGESHVFSSFVVYFIPK